MKGSKFDGFKPEIDTMISQGIFSCVVLQERSQENGYDGGITILKEYVRQYRPAVIGYETPPGGKQAQMDWGIVHYTDENGSFHKAPAL